MRVACTRIVLGLAASLVAVGPARGEPPTTGRVLYLQFCSSCHGPEGRGDGEDAPGLALPPPDLTTLHERYGTPLPRKRIAEFIDGRADVAAHGPRDMPVWGEELWLGAPGPPRGIEAAKRQTIEELLDYLEAIQGFRETRRR